LLSGMRDLVSSSVGPTVEVHLRVDPDLSSALVDPNQLELAILNLAVNARDAMPQGGPLTILAEEVALGPQSSPKLKPGLYIKLSVIDAGCGMDSETMGRAVEPFYSTKEFGRGTGLGLSMVHGLAAQLGGGFSLTSALGEGTRVDLYLPVAGEDASTQRRQVPASMKTIGRRLSVLLIDDEPLVRTATAEMIRDLGHHVEEAGGGAEALARLGDGLSVDVVITDYMMPGIDGGTLSRRIAQSQPDVPVLLITGYTGPTDDILHLPRLAKPFGQAEIAEALSSLFADDQKVVRFPGRKPSK
jgi:CheY-like chemotaxis protein